MNYSSWWISVIAFLIAMTCGISCKDSTPRNEVLTNSFPATNSNKIDHSTHMDSVKSESANNEHKRTTSVKPSDRITFFENLFSCAIPQQMRKMTREEITIKYPHADPSKLEAFHFSDGEVSLAFELTRESSVKSIEALLTQMENQVLNEPALQFLSREVITCQNSNIGAIRFSSMAVDGIVYNLLLFIPTNEYLVMGNFNCTERFYSEWEKRGDEIAKSIMIVSSLSVE